MSTWRCALCPAEGTSDNDGLALGAHFDDCHNPRSRHPKTPLLWENEALRLIREAATTGRQFTVAEVLAPLGEYPDPDQRQYVAGKLTRRLSQQGVIVAVGAVESVKATTKASLVRQWRGAA